MKHIDAEYIAKVISGRVHDYIVFDTKDKFNSPKEAARRYELVRQRLRGIVGIDELEISEERQNENDRKRV